MYSGDGFKVFVSRSAKANRYHLRIRRITQNGKLLQESLAIFWYKRRPLPRYAFSFCEMLAEHAHAVLPITRISA